MTEKLQLPNPAPKGSEHEKWKAMVDSVIEFISASRTMLHVLNERVIESERLKLEEKKRLQDERDKLAFYNECLHCDLKPKKDSKSAPIEDKALPTVSESGDAYFKRTISDNKKGTTKKNADKLCKPENKPSVSNKEYQVLHLEYRQDALEIVKNKEDKTCNKTQLEHVDKKICPIHKKVEFSPKNISEANVNLNDTQPTLIEQNAVDTSPPSPKENLITSNESKSMECKKIHDKENLNKLVLASKDTQSPIIKVNDANTSPPMSFNQNASTLIKCKKIPANKSAQKVPPAPVLPANYKSVPFRQSGGTLIKCQKASRIPRTKSYNEDKNKCSLVELTPTQGDNVAKGHCSKKCQREATYRTIHQRSQFPKE